MSAECSDKLEDAQIIFEQSLNVAEIAADEEIDARGGDTYLKNNQMPEPCMPCRANGGRKHGVAARRNAKSLKLQTFHATRRLRLIVFDDLSPRASRTRNVPPF